MAIPLHTPADIYSRRHVPSWLLLAGGAGAVNAGALLACERFVSHVTGSATRVGVDAGQWMLMLDYLMVIAAFIAGAMASVLAIAARHARGLAPLYAVPLLVVVGVLVAVAAGGRAGWFGPFGGELEQPGDFLLLCVLGFAMGLQNATVATSTSMAIRTTHMTGPATDFGVQLATSIVTSGEARRTALQGALLRGAKLVAFILGGVAMLPAASSWGFAAFLVPAVAIAIATALSFSPAPIFNPMLRGAR